MKKNFFLFFLFITNLYSFNYRNLYESDTWKSLLHYRDGVGFEITDKKFFISKQPTLKKEFFAAIRAFRNGKYQCKFPARKLYLESKLHLKFPKEKCPSLDKYIREVPIDKIYLVFASENIKDPSSMMGHTFFKFAGRRKNGFYATHAISFFTMVNTFDPFVLLYKNIFPGMEGFFVLRPYKGILYEYLINENRNVWEYLLKLNKYQKKMIFFHIWELKGIKQRYYFTSYNCASVIYYILSSAVTMKKYKFWLTPLGLIKMVNKENLIKKANLLPSDEWFIKLLESELSFYDIYKIKKSVLNDNINAFNLKKNKINFYKITLAKVYINYLHNKKYNKLKNFLFKQKFNYTLDLSKYKNPLKTPPERMLSLSFLNEKQNNNYLKISFLPASHTLNDNNREYFNESQLKIGYFSFLVNKHQLLLDNFTFYNMVNLIPYDILTNPLSYNFNLSFQREYNEKLKKKLYFTINFGLGYDVNFLKDINIYCLMNLKDRFNHKNDFLYYPKIGVLIYEIFNSKLNFNYKMIFDTKEKLYSQYSLRQTFFLKNNYQIYFNIKQTNKIKNLEIGVQKLF